MQTETNDYKSLMLKYISSLMSDRLISTVHNYLFAYGNIYEIRLRLDTPLAFTLSDGNLITGMICKRDDINTIIDRMTGGSYFKNEELMRQGIITLKYGIRVGVCGDVFLSGGAVKTLKSISYINIRIPSQYIIDCSLLINHIKESNFSSSVLIFSPPCYGKTTYLRSVANALSSAPIPKRVCVIDTNHELFYKNPTVPSFCDYLFGYPKPYGITIAYRYMNPEYIICDEIVEKDEAEALLITQHTGVPLIASTHADSFSALLNKKNIATLIENGVFDTLLKIKKVNKGFAYEIKKVSEI